MPTQIATPKVNVPLPQSAPHPLRFGINGVSDTIPALQEFVSKLEYDEAVKGFMLSELAKLKTNAARINLHDVQRVDGGFDLHLSIAAIQMGATAGSITTGAKLTAGNS